MSTESTMVAVETQLAEDKQTKFLATEERLCLRHILEDALLYNPLTNDSCPPVWDGILCWSRAPAGLTLFQSCPAHVVGFSSQANASKLCTESGTWYARVGNFSWTNFSQCYNGPDATFIIDTDASINNVSYIEPYLLTLKTISEIGYAVSLITLLLSLIIFSSIRKLRCPRNVLHMHLFASFVMRAFMSLLKDSVFQRGLGTSFDVFMRDDGQYFNYKQEEHWLCRMMVSLWQYFIMANYSWILMEGLYLHSLIFLALFTDSSSIMMYILLGWGLPALFVLPWSILRALLENTWCWTTNDFTTIFLLIRAPTIASIMVNFILFLNIIRVLLLKMNTSIREKTKKYRRWAKSTLILVPLFGVHYMVFLGLHLSSNKTAEIAWLFCDQLFASFNGFFVALFYCFLNEEVRTELIKKWNSLFFQDSAQRSRIVRNHIHNELLRKNVSLEANNLSHSSSSSVNIGHEYPAVDVGCGKNNFYHRSILV